MFNPGFRKGYSTIPGVMFNLTQEKMAAPNNAYYVLTQAHAGLPNHQIFNTLGDARYLLLDGSNANSDIDLDSYNLTSTGYLKQWRHGSELIISQDNYNMANAPVDTRYFVFNIQATGTYNWNTIVPDPGIVARTWSFREIIIINASWLSSTAGRIILTIYHPVGGDSGSRFLVPNGSSTITNFQLPAGGTVKLYATEVSKAAKNPKWVWVVMPLLGAAWIPS